jgi:hypothetical protein
VLFLLTIVRRDWIEVMFGVDPDRHSGSFEWLVISSVLALTVVSFSLAALEWRRAVVVPVGDR